MFKNWQHSISAVLSIASGFVAIGVFRGYTDFVRQQFEDGYEHRFMLGDVIIYPAQDGRSQGDDGGVDLGVFDTTGKRFLTPADQEIVREFFSKKKSKIKLSLRFLDVSGMVTNGKSNTIFAGYGMEEPSGAAMRGKAWEWNTIAGKPLYLTSNQYPLVVGKNMAGLMDCQAVGLNLDSVPLIPYLRTNADLKCLRSSVQLNTTTITGQVNALDGVIVGVMDGGIPALDRRWITMPLGMAQMLADTKDLSMYTVQLNGRVNINRFIADFNDFAKTHQVKLVAESWKTHKYGAVYRKAMKILGIMRSFVLIVVVAIGSMTVINTLIKSVNERTREIGTLRSIGFLRREIMTMFAYEGFFLACIGIVVGLLLTLLIIFLVDRSGLTYDPGFISSRVPLRISFIPMIYLLSAIVLGIISVLAALYPASKAAKMNIPEALSH